MKAKSPPLTMPSAADYKVALENLSKTTPLPRLKGYHFVKSRRGSPLIYSGGFAMTCPIQHPTTGDKLALRFFYHLPDDIQERYQAISAFISANLDSGLFAEVVYEPKGIVVNGQHFPVCVMDWLEGDTLGVYIRTHLHDQAKIRPLAEKFRDLVTRLHHLSAAHGDLSHENIMVVKGKLQLVDYDGMYVPALNGKQPCIVGQPGFQHPARAKDRRYFGVYQDDFSAIALYLSLRGLQYDPSLYTRYENGGNSLLFRKEDFLKPNDSVYLRELERIADLRELVERFRLVCAGSIRHVPPLEKFLKGLHITEPPLDGLAVDEAENVEVDAAMEEALLHDDHLITSEPIDNPTPKPTPNRTWIKSQLALKQPTPVTKPQTPDELFKPKPTTPSFGGFDDE